MAEKQCNLIKNGGGMNNSKVITLNEQWRRAHNVASYALLVPMDISSLDYDMTINITKAELFSGTWGNITSQFRGVINNGTEWLLDFNTQSTPFEAGKTYLLRLTATITLTPKL